MSTSASIHRAGLASLRVRHERSRAHTIMAKPRRSVRTLQHARCRVRRPSSVQACAHMSARTDVHLILVGALRACAGAHCASCCQRAGQGYSHRNRRHRRQCSWKHSRSRCRKDSQTCARGSTRPAPLPETQHPPCMRSRRKTRLLKTTMQEAEKAIEELMAVVDKEKKKAAEPQVFHRHEELCERA